MSNRRRLFRILFGLWHRSRSYQQPRAPSQHKNQANPSYLCRMTDASSIIDLGKKIIVKEQETLIALAHGLNESFAKAVQLIHKCSGRVVLTGVGKSAIIGQKITATLNSTGTPAHFLHAADALHGDLGMLQPTDLLIALSKSGETTELKSLLPAISRLSVPLIAITSNPSSSLAMTASLVLTTPAHDEADPLNLAPTSSTTAQLALGDALAITVMQLRGFSSTDFARNHPGGKLGKQLTLRIEDLVGRNAKPAVSPHENMREVIQAISHGRLGAVVVLSENDEVLGIITDGDLRRMMEQHSHFDGLVAAQQMHPKPKSVLKSTLAVEALALMQEHNISQVVVLDDETRKYAGMVHLHDLLREGLA